MTRTYPLEVPIDMLLTLDDIKHEGDGNPPEVSLLEQGDLEERVDEVRDELPLVASQLVPQQDHLLACRHTKISKPEIITYIHSLVQRGEGNRQFSY